MPDPPSDPKDEIIMRCTWLATRREREREKRSRIFNHPFRYIPALDERKSGSVEQGVRRKGVGGSLEKKRATNCTIFQSPLAADSEEKQLLIEIDGNSSDRCRALKFHYPLQLVFNEVTQ